MDRKRGFPYGARPMLGAVAPLIALLGGLFLIAPPATASVPADGALTISFNRPQNGGGASVGRNAPLGSLVRIQAGGSATSTGGANSVEVRMPVTGVSVGSNRSVTRVGGTLIFNRGDRRQVLSQVRVVSAPLKGTFVTARIGNADSRIRAFTVQGLASTDRQVGTMRFRKRITRLTGGLSSRLVSRLDLRSRPSARTGRARLAAQGPFEDPYSATCDLPATSKVAGTLPTAPDPSPVQPGTTAVGDGIFWGLRSGLRNYLYFLPEAQGVMQGVDGGVVVPNPAPPPAPPVPIGFAFPFADGAWDLGEEGAADDRAVLNGSGSILLCHKTQFRILLSKPSIVINGFRARLVFDVDTNVLGEWIPTQRVKLAQLVTTEGSFSETGESATWSDVPVVLTAAGSDALRLAPFSPTFRYQAGQALESISFTLTSTLADGRG